MHIFFYFSKQGFKVPIWDWTLSRYKGDSVHGYNADSKRGDDTFIAFNKIPEEMIGPNESGSAFFLK